ncbi:hypothetical protein Tco_1318268 [Tanacetum coccineum]
MKARGALDSRRRRNGESRVRQEENLRRGTVREGWSVDYWFGRDMDFHRPEGEDGLAVGGRSPYGVVDATKRGTPTRSEEIFSEGDGLGRKDWEELRVAKGGASTEPDAHQCLELILVVQMLTSVRSRKPVPTKTSNSFSPKRPHVNQFNQRRFTLTQSQSLNHPLKNTDRIEGIIDMDAQGMTELIIVVPSTVRNTEEKAESRNLPLSSKKEEILDRTSTREEGNFYNTQKIILRF